MDGFTARISRDHVPPRPARHASAATTGAQLFRFPCRRVAVVPLSLSPFHLLNARVLMMNSLFVLLHWNG